MLLPYKQENANLSYFTIRPPLGCTGLGNGLSAWATEITFRTYGCFIYFYTGMKMHPIIKCCMWRGPPARSDAS